MCVSGPALCNPMDGAHQAPLSMEFSRQEYWSGLPCPPPGDLPDSGIEPMSLMSPALAGRFFTTSTTWEAQKQTVKKYKYIFITSGFTVGQRLGGETSQVALVVKNLPANAGDIRDAGSIPGSARSPGGGHGNPPQCSCLENLRSLVGYCP